MDETTEPETTTGTPEEVETPRTEVSRTVLILSVLAATAIAGIAGLVIGWKVEQNRVKDDLGNIRPVGRVTAVEGESVTIDLLTSSGSRTYVLTDDTVVHEAASAEESDVAEGSTVLVKSRRDGGGDLRAIEVIILPDSTTFGSGRDD